jgi:hypothetical protein
MSALEDDLFEDLAFEGAEGEAEQEDYFEMEDYADGFEDEFEDGFEMEALEDEGNFFEDDYDAYEYDAYEEDEAAEDAMESAMAYALGADEADEFFGKLVKGLKKVGGKVVSGIKKAAPVVGKIASGVSRVASLIPHPYAKAIGTAAGVVGKAANLAQKLRAEGATEEEALDAFAEMAARDPRALPIVAGLTARTVLKSQGAQLSPAARKQVVNQIKNATDNLVAKRGPAAVRAMPKIARTVKRAAAAKGISPVSAIKVVKRATGKVARSPGLARKLARPNPAAQRMVRAAGGAGGTVAPRSFTIPGPARITITSV